MVDSPKFCPRCGQPVEEGARVCEACGAKLASGGLSADQEQKSARQRFDWTPFLTACGVLAGIGIVLILTVSILVGYRLLPELLSSRLPAAATASVAAPTVTAAVALAPTQPALQTPAAPATPIPTLAAPVSSGPPANVVYGGVSFYLDPAIAGSVNAQSLPATLPGDNVANWDVIPHHFLIDLNQYALADTFHNPRIYVLGVDEFEKISPQAAQIIQNLRAMLQTRPQQVKDVPFLPFWNAAQLFHARLSYLDFRDGSGVRFLTEYGQAFAPIGNYSIFYCFQGLTSDGKYYISAILPISNPILPAGKQFSQQDYDAVAKDIQAYLADITAKLEAQTPASFTPSLDALDGMIKTIAIR